jgi:DNA modification methylase
MIIEIKKISELTPAPYNPRESTEKQESQLKQSLKKFGVVEPIIYNKQTGHIVGGHFRVRELQKLGYTEIECVIVDLSEEDEKELNIRLNANTGQWDWDELANNFELDDLNDWGLEVPNMKHELEAEEDDFDVDADGIETDIVVGDLFEIGEHRLLCGDSTDSDAVARLMDGQKADMVFTDPPYNVDFAGQELSNTTKDGKQILHHKGANSKHDKIKNDSMPDQEFMEFMKGVLSNVALFNKGAWYFCFCDLKLDLILTPLKEMGFNWKSIIIWKKNQATLSGKDYKSKYEPIIYGCPESSFYGERYKQEDIWEFQRTLKNDLHPTMKPIPLIENAVKNSSKEGMTVMDLFLGSGSTMVASHQLKRKCYGMELDPKYCQVIIDRMRKLDPTLKIKRNGVEI